MSSTWNLLRTVADAEQLGVGGGMRENYA